jgi:hypothetical protein
MRNKSLFYAFMVSLALTIVGCGGTVDNRPEGIEIGIGDAVLTVPNDVTVDGVVNGQDTVAMSAGANQEVGAFAAVGGSRTGTTLSQLHLAETMINNDAFSSTLSVLTEQVYKNPENSVGDYTLTVNAPMASVAVAAEISRILTGKSEFPAAAAGASETTQFRLLLSVLELNGRYYYQVAVVPDSAYDNFGAIAESIVSSGNLTIKYSAEFSAADTFTGIDASTNLTDFLFVIDDSGSMGDEQEAVKAVSEDFGAAVNNAGLDFNIAIISTGDKIDDTSCVDGDCALRVVNSVGIIDNDITLFKNNIVLGTSGSPIETGIYNAERVLIDNGILAAKNFPREGAALSVVIMSDEVSQYDSRAGKGFNVNNNLFTSNNYAVYSLVDLNESGQYTDLSASSGGFSANILNVNPSTGLLDYKLIMEKLAKSANAAASTYRLSKPNVKPLSITVEVNGTKVENNFVNGWAFNTGTNSIAFYGSAIPAVGAPIEVTYLWSAD